MEYARYARENEDLQEDTNETWCESCGIQLSENLIICKKCETFEDNFYQR